MQLSAHSCIVSDSQIAMQCTRKIVLLTVHNIVIAYTESEQYR